MSKFRRRYLLLVVVLIVLALVPLFVHGPYIQQLCILSMMYALLALSWNLINGYTGIFTFGHQAFFGLGAYTSALISMHLSLTPWLTIWIGGIMAGVGGFVIALPVLRIRSIAHIAIITLAFAEIVRIVISNLTGITRGVLGLSGIPPFTEFSLPGVGVVSFGVSNPVACYYVVFALLVGTLILLDALLHSRYGLAFTAIRDSDDAAESLGVNLTRYKLIAFVVSSFIAGVTGAFYAHYLHVLTPASVVGISIMIKLLVITLIGGIGTMLGPLFGAFLVTFGLEGLRVVGDYRLMVYGGLLILFVTFMPRGLARLGLPTNVKDLLRPRGRHPKREQP